MLMTTFMHGIWTWILYLFKNNVFRKVHLLGYNDWLGISSKFTKKKKITLVVHSFNVNTKYNGKNVNIPAFADDVVIILIAETMESMETFIEETENGGREINEVKTKFIEVQRDRRNGIDHLQVGSYNFVKSHFYQFLKTCTLRNWTLDKSISIENTLDTGLENNSHQGRHWGERKGHSINQSLA